jgi:hypothetical protein
MSRCTPCWARDRSLTLSLTPMPVSKSICTTPWRCMCTLLPSCRCLCQRRTPCADSARAGAHLCAQPQGDGEDGALPARQGARGGAAQQVHAPGRGLARAPAGAPLLLGLAAGRWKMRRLLHDDTCHAVTRSCCSKNQVSGFEIFAPAADPALAACSKRRTRRRTRR